jgi:hypothetical protein
VVLTSLVVEVVVGFSLVVEVVIISLVVLTLVVGTSEVGPRMTHTPRVHQRFDSWQQSK